MTTLVLERPKDVDLAELFEINVKIVPGRGGNKSRVLEWRTIPLGTPVVQWTVPAGAGDALDGVLIYWPRSKRYDWLRFSRGMVRVFQLDILLVNIKWSI